MTNRELAERYKEIAERLRGIPSCSASGELVYKKRIEEIADELDPSKSEPATLVWCLTDFNGEPEELFLSQVQAEEYNHEHFGGVNRIFAMTLPARILTDDEWVVKFPPEYNGITLQHDLTAECDRLRETIESAYREGWRDALRVVGVHNHSRFVENAGWNESDARAALQEATR